MTTTSQKHRLFTSGRDMLMSPDFDGSLSVLDSQTGREIISAGGKSGNHFVLPSECNTNVPYIAVLTAKDGSISHKSVFFTDGTHQLQSKEVTSSPAEVSKNEPGTICNINDFLFGDKKTAEGGVMGVITVTNPQSSNAEVFSVATENMGDTLPQFIVSLPTIK